ncbi:MAG: hypothetical protein WEC41_04695 [Dongiaceae bacterium]
MSMRTLLATAVAVGLFGGGALAHESWGHGADYGPGCGMMMGPGMMGPGMMGPGMMGPGMMGPGMTGPGMMGQQPGPGMGPGMMGQGPGFGMGPGGSFVMPLARDLSADEVRHMLEHRLAWHGNERLKIGTVEEKDADTIVAEIVTVDGSLVQRLEVDRHTGVTRPAS